MAKILAIDFGTKRTGYAISDASKIFAFGLSTQETKNNLSYLKKIVPTEKIDTIVIGLPKKLNNELADIVPKINAFIQQIHKEFPEISIKQLDERFTSKMAFQSMLDSGMKKKDRQNKSLIDEISATILLQNFLEYKN
jgi:putative Holliday junction resolvase